MHKCISCEGKLCVWCKGTGLTTSEKAYGHAFCEIYDLVDAQRHQYLNGLNIGDTSIFIVKINELIERIKIYSEDIEN